MVTSGPNLASVMLATISHSSFIFGNSVKPRSTTEMTRGFHYRLVSVFPQEGSWHPVKVSESLATLAAA